jgi:acyl-CoA reductase-like NAD-dependent aldehyde dehydrogenase/nicotinamidase-related amidase
MKTLLLLIDLQGDFLDAPGLEPHRESVIAGAALLAGEARRRNIPVAHVWTTIDPKTDERMPHWKERGIRMCISDTPGHAVPAPLAPEANEAVFHKTRLSAFSAPGFESFLRDGSFDALVLAGVHIQTCLRQTALDAYQKGWQVCLARDAIGSHDPFHGALTIDYLDDRAIPALRHEELVARLEGKEPVAAPETAAGEIERVISAIRESLPKWQKLPRGARGDILKKIALLLERDCDSLARAITQEVGKPIFYARGEVARSAALLRAVSERAGREDEERVEREGTVRDVPRGIVAMITPWNNPLAIPTGKIAPALMYGNGVAWKPSPRAPQIAAALLALMREAGVPPDLVRLVHGDARTARRLIGASPDAVAFSGSLQTGWSVLAQSAARVLPVQAELGGNNATIVCADADLDRASEAVVEGAFGFCGQRCTANRRVIVVSEIYDDFLSRLETAALQLPCGDPREEKTRVGPMISAGAARRIAAWVERARQDGCRVWSFPAAKPPGAGESFYPPTLICCDRPDAAIIQEETFGPLLIVQKARDFDEALRLLNQCRQGLVAALFSGHEPFRQRFLSEARAGILKLNRSTVDAGVDLPFVGWKHSGYGAAEHGEANRDFFTRRQSIYGW